MFSTRLTAAFCLHYYLHCSGTYVSFKTKKQHTVLLEAATKNISHVITINILGIAPPSRQWPKDMKIAWIIE
jgi:hypothetical protein